MYCRLFSKWPTLFSLATTLGAIVTILGGTAQAQLLWYDGFAIGDDDGAGPNYVAGSIAGQQGGSDAGSGIGFFDDGAGNPNPWLPANPDDIAADDTTVEAGSLHAAGQSIPSLGGKASGEPVSDNCCYTSRTAREFNTPFAGLDDTIYMGFLVNYGNGNPADPHYRSVEFWNGGVGDDFLNMSLGFSSFGNYNGAVNQGDDPDPNTQLSLGIDGVREMFGVVEHTNHQLDEHLEFADQMGKTHSIVLKFELSTDDVEAGGIGDSVSVFLNPTHADTVEPTPSLVVDNLDLNLDRMSSIILFTFTGEVNNPGAFDELRVGNTWGDVAILVPEPAALSLLGFGALGLLLGVDRQRT